MSFISDPMKTIYFECIHRSQSIFKAMLFERCIRVGILQSLAHMLSFGTTYVTSVYIGFIDFQSKDQCLWSSPEAVHMTRGLLWVRVCCTIFRCGSSLKMN